MTEKQLKFCEYYLQTLNATESAKKAGYSEKTAKQSGQRLLTFVDVKEYIEKRLEEQDAKLVADTDEIMKYLTSVMRREQKENIVIVVSEKVSESIKGEDGKMHRQTTTKEKAEVVEIPAKLSDANKSAELLGKRYKLFTDKTVIEGAIPVVITGEDDLDE